MSSTQKTIIFLLRVAFGIIFIYSGLTKVLDPSWSAYGFLNNAKTFTAFYQTLAGPQILPVINFINAWGQLLLGVSLILGIFVRLSSFLGAALMLLYYFPALNFPYPNAHSFLVDEHIIYSLILVYFAVVGAGRYWGLDNWCSRLPICAHFPRLRALFG